MKGNSPREAVVKGGRVTFAAAETDSCGMASYCVAVACLFLSANSFLKFVSDIFTDSIGVDG